MSLIILTHLSMVAPLAQTELLTIAFKSLVLPSINRRRAVAFVIFAMQTPHEVVMHTASKFKPMPQTPIDEGRTCKLF